MFTSISVISINTCAFVANALLAPLLYGEYMISEILKQIIFIYSPKTTPYPGKACHELPRYPIIVQRLFSTGGKIFHPDPCCLGDRVFKQLMCKKNNPHFD